VPKAHLAELPGALLEAFLHSNGPKQGWRRLLEFLSPITITGGLLIEGFS
jgi:hypothetical protein